MRMGRRDHVRPRLVHARMNRERSFVDRHVPFDHPPAPVHQNQVGNADVREVNSERVDPEAIGPFRIACRDVPGYAFAESELGEEAEGAREPLLAVQSLFTGRGECGQRRRGRHLDVGSSWCCDHD